MAGAGMTDGARAQALIAHDSNAPVDFEADVLDLFENPQNPYSRALLSALPENAKGDRLPTVADFMAAEALK